jgi:predicted membrane-bound mannosyltransferase
VVVTGAIQYALFLNVLDISVGCGTAFDALLCRKSLGDAAAFLLLAVPLAVAAVVFFVSRSWRHTLLFLAIVIVLDGAALFVMEHR